MIYCWTEQRRVILHLHISPIQNENSLSKIKGANFFHQIPFEHFFIVFLWSILLFHQPILQWAPLNGITVKGIIWLMGSNWPRLIMSQFSLNSIHCVRSIFSYYYHSVNGISYGLVQSNPIKRRPLYRNYHCFSLTPFSQHSQVFD